MMDEQRTWLRSRRKRCLGILTAMLSVCVLITTYPGIPATLSVFASEEPELSLPDTLEAASFRSVSPGNTEIGNGQDAQPEDGAESEETDEPTEPTETNNGEPFAIQEESLAIQEEMAAADGAHGEHAGWTKLTGSTTTLTAGGNYYLDEDITVSNELKVTGGTVTLCLNGHTLSRRSSDAKSWIIAVESGATLNVYDCAGGGMMEATSKGGGISTAGTLNVYGGIINGKDSAWWNKDQVTLTYGAGICAQAGSEVNLFGGTVKGTMSSGVYVVSGGKLTVDGAEVISQFESHPDGYAASIYIEGGAETWIKSGFVSWSSETYNSCTIFVSPGGSLNVSGGTVSQERDDVAGAIAVTKHSYHTSSDTGHVVISGGTVSTPIAATSGMRVTVSGGHVIKEVVLRGAVLELSGDQDIQGGAGTDIIIGVDRSDDAVVKMAIGKIELTGALTNTKPYMVRLEGLRPSSVYPLTITEGFDSYMSGRKPTDYFVSTDGYKIVLLDGEVAFVPYVMTFDANGGSVATTQGDINGGYQMRALPEPTREHYNFDGWYTAKTGGDKITIDTMPAGRDLTVYAHWTPVDYGISYDLAGGMLQDGDSNPASYHIETPDFALKNPVRASYIFTGWSGTGLTGTANKAVTVSMGSTGERAYTAHWEEAKYKVTVSTYKDDALWSSGAPAVKLTADNGSSFVTDLTAVGNGSYRIYSGDTDTGVTVTVGGADATGRVDYYTLSFYDRNSELTQNRQTVLKNCEAQKPSAPTRTGYIFAGWCDNADLTGTPVTEISTPITAKQTFYAKWTAAEYKVTFDYQGATGDSTVTDKTVTYEAAYGELPTPTKAEYVFKGWYTSKNGQGDPVTAAAIVQNASDHTLFAYWKDETAPDKPVLQDGVTLPAGWTKAQDTIPLKLYDGVGVTALLVSVDGSPYAEVSGFSGGTGSVNYSYTAVQEGEHKYQFKAVDAAGNFAESDIFTVKLDRTKPEIGTLTYENEVHINFWHWIIGKKSMIVHVPVTDTGSGVTEISFCLTPRDAAGNLDSSSAVTKTAAVSGGEAKITFDKDFRGTIAISCTDVAGNAADGVTIGKDAGGVIVEDQAPTITIQADRNISDTQQTQPGGVDVSERYYNSAPALIVTVKDDTGNAITAGIATVTYQVGNGDVEPVSVNTGLQAEVSFTIPASEIPTGSTEIVIKTTDNAGNPAGMDITINVKGPEKRPDAEIDYRQEELTGLVPNGIYSIDGTETAADQEGRIPIGSSWFGTTVSIVRKGNGSETSDSPAQNLPIPARSAAPTVPELSVRTENSIALKTITGAQYRLAEGGQNGQDSTIFEGLNAGTVYSFKAYYPATDTSFASEESSPVQIATVPTAPTKDKLEISCTTETFTLTGGIEAFTDQSCQTSVNGNDVTVYMGQTMYIRYPANGIIPESPTISVAIPERPATPVPGTVDASYPKAADGAITGLSADTAYEYRVKDQNGSFGTWQDAALNGTRIENLPAGEYEVRVKAVNTGNISFRSETAAVTLGEKPATKYETPDIRVDHTAGTLTGFAPGAEYTINGKTVTASPDGIINIETEWFGAALSIVREDNGKDKLDSDAQSLSVPARPQKPAPAGADVSTAGGTGKLTGLTAGITYEVSADGGKTWVSRTADGGGQITELAPGTYVVRVKAETSGFASESSDPIKIGSYQIKEPGEGSSNPSGGNGGKGEDSEPTPTPMPQPSQLPIDTSTLPAYSMRPTSVSPTTPPAVESGPEDRKPETTPEPRETPGPEELKNGETRPTSESEQPQIQDAAAENLTYPVGEGAVIITLNNVDETVCAAKVADAAAVAHAVLSEEEFAEAGQGQIIEIRIDVERLVNVSEDDAEVIGNGIEDCQEQIPGLAMGMYVDISMYMRVGNGDWNAIHATNEPVEIILNVPDELRELTADLYIMRAHEGEYLLMEDLDDAPETITIRTEAFSTYAILYRMQESGGGKTAAKCGLCHICPTFLGICCFVWIAIIILVIILAWIILRKKKE